ncbi:MAG: tetratricopeptide repeat protein [Rhodospirillales bacterium]|nr:tetratricopeptide repeat protein [Rhodospirillales bacterium]
MVTVLGKYMGLILEEVADTGTHVFRGQRDARWPLRSGASRRIADNGFGEGDPQYVEEYLEYHRDLLDRARRIAPYGQSGLAENGLQLLAKLQHFGAATGLLDFTYSPLVALWFASKDPSRDGKVFFVSHELPDTTFVTAEQETQDIANILSTTKDAAESSYLLWEPVADGDAALRIVGQRSVFVIGRPVVDEERVNAVRIEATDKEQLRTDLEQVDVSERTIFRDLVGFCQQEAATARRNRPMTAAAYLRRANAAFLRGEYRDAVEMYGKSLELGETCETYFLRGNGNAALGRHGEAVEDYGRALEAPDVAGEDGPSTDYPWFLYAIYFNRGNEQACRRRYADAIEDYEQSAQLAPGNRAMYFNCGNAYFMEKRYGEAVASYDRALALDRRYAPALVNKALSLVLQGRLEEAEACYREAIRAEPQPGQTLDSLELVRAAVSGLAESQMTIEVVDDGDGGLRATAKHPEYRGAEGPVAGFRGIVGSVGNFGVYDLGGGKGLEGGPGVVFVMERG